MPDDTPRICPTGVHRSDKWTAGDRTGAEHQVGPPVSVRTVRLGGGQVGSTGVGRDFSTAATAFFAAFGATPPTGTVPSCAAMRPAT